MKTVTNTYSTVPSYRHFQKEKSSLATPDYSGPTTYLKRKMFRGGKISRFSRIGRQSQNFYAENGLILLNFKQCKCNTAKLFRRNTNVHAIRETSEHFAFKVTTKSRALQMNAPAAYRL